jgi:hypothetical protein
MTETRRDRFLKRISSVGGGTRDAIQMLMGSIVLDLRDFVERGIFDEVEMDTAVAFHDEAEEFWRRTMQSKPPMDPLLMVSGLRQLGDGCIGPLVGFQPRLEQALEKATAFAESSKYGRG